MTGGAPTAEPERLLYLDALRGWAILLVVLTHAAQGEAAVEALTWAAPASPVLALPGWLATICARGGSGVHLFFVVSALSLTFSIRARREGRLSAYLTRRFFRLAPMFYVGIALYLLIAGLGPRLYAPAGIGPVDILLTLSFLHVWSANALNSVVPGDWSVGVEWMFYLILPLLLAFGRTPLRLAVLTMAFVLIAQAVQLSGAGFGPFGKAGFPGQAAVFLFGLIAAAVRPGAAGATGSAPTGFAALALFLLLVFGLPLWHLPEDWLVYHVQFAAAAALLCVLLARSPVPILVNGVLAKIGRVSFSMYVLHFALLAPVLAAVRRLVGPDASGLRVLAVYYPLLVAISVACAAVTYAAIEQPGIALGRRLAGWRQRRGAVFERTA